MRIADRRLESRNGSSRSLRAEDDRKRVRTTDCPVPMQQAFHQPIERCTTMEDHVGAVFHLAHVHAVPAPFATPIAISKERNEDRQPTQAASLHTTSRQRIRQRLQPDRVRTYQKSIAARAKLDSFLVHPAGQPLVTVQTEPRIEQEIGTATHEHLPEVVVTQVEVVLPHETRLHFDVRLPWLA